MISSESGYEGPWHWLNGRRISQKDRRWLSNSPNGRGWGPFCLCILFWKEVDSWVDEECGFTFKAVCEIVEAEDTIPTQMPTTEADREDASLD